MRKPYLIIISLLAIVFNFRTVLAQTDSPSSDIPASQQGTIDFKITTLNAEWLSCSQNGPDDDNLQISNLAVVIAAVNPDVIALQEVGTSSSYASIDTLVKKLGNDWGGSIVAWSEDNCSQNQGIIYKKAKVQLVNSSLITNGGSSRNWSSGRYPALYDLSLVVGSTTIPVSLINIHAKASSDETSYSRRQAASVSLKSLLDGSSFNTKKVILLGDYNDYLIGSQCSTYSDVSPYKNFIDDATNYKGLTSALTDPYYNSPVIDNIIISNEIFDAYVANSVIRETTATQKVSNYSSTTTDHTPVSATFRFTIPTDVPSVADMSGVSLYPNPASDYITVKCSLRVDHVSVFALTGEMLLSAENTGDRIDVSALPKGVYIVLLKTERGYCQQKMVKY